MLYRLIDHLTNIKEKDILKCSCRVYVYMQNYFKVQTVDKSYSYIQII